MNTQSNAVPESSRDSHINDVAGNRARGHVGDSAHVLVDAARIVGEPFDLHRAAGGRPPVGSVRLPDRTMGRALSAYATWLSGARRSQGPYGFATV